MNKGKLYYTYIDECKKNYLTQVMQDTCNYVFQEYSITSLTFYKKSYEDKLEHEWKNFREKYNLDSKHALHFVEFKKLISAKDRTEENPMYKYFSQKGVFSEERLKNFFKDLKKILEENDYFIVHTDYYWEKKNYLIKRNNFEKLQFKKSVNRNIAPNTLNAVPYVAMKKHLDSLLMTFLKRRVEDNDIVEDGYYFDEELPKRLYTKLRFDADGKEFDARSDLKKAYNHVVAIGSDNVKQSVAVEILDEIRFIRKEEVGNAYIPSHCGLEIVDFLCSMISGETRLEEYKKDNEGLKGLEKGEFLNIKFEDGETIEFYDTVMNKLLYRTINFLNY